MPRRFRSFLVWTGVAGLMTLAGWSWFYALRPAAPAPIGSVQATLPQRRALTPEDLEYGTQQLERMLKSRPAMRKYLAPGDAMWEWARRQFAGEYLPIRIVWRDDEPAKDQEAECNYDPEQDPPAFIRVRKVWATGPDKGRQKTFDVLWSEAAFELHNIRTAAEANVFWTQACRGRLSKQQWIRANAGRELEAARQTHEFYKAVWVPYCRQKSIPYDPRWWWASTTFELDSFLAYSTAKNSPNAYWYEYWNSTWDNVIAPYLAQTGRAPARPVASRPVEAVGS